MSLYRRGGVFWSYVWVDGIRHAKSTGTSKRREAERFDEAFKTELERLKHQPPELNPEMTFEHLFTRFVASGIAKRYHIDRSKPLLPFFGKLALNKITRGEVTRYRLIRRTENKVTDTTVNRDIECLRHMLYWAVDEGILLQNPLSRIALVRERRHRRPVLSLEQEELLLDAASPHLRSVIVAALDTGMRRGEILQQRWEDVDFARRLLFVTHSKTAEGESREIPLTTRFYEWLRTNSKTTGAVFTFKGQPIHRIKTAWRGALKRSQIPRFRFHDLRHTFNSRLMLAGVQQEIRKSLMGHSSGEDVNSIYTHVELPAKYEAIQKLELWREVQQQSHQETGGTNDGTKATGAGLGPVSNLNSRSNTETMGQEDPGGSRLGADNEAGKQGQ